MPEPDDNLLGVNPIRPALYNQVLREFGVDCIEFLDGPGGLRFKIVKDGYDETKVITSLVAGLVVASARLHRRSL